MNGRRDRVRHNSTASLTKPPRYAGCRLPRSAASPTPSTTESASPDSSITSRTPQASATRKTRSTISSLSFIHPSTGSGRTALRISRCANPVRAEPVEACTGAETAFRTTALRAKRNRRGTLAAACRGRQPHLRLPPPRAHRQISRSPRANRRCPLRLNPAGQLPGKPLPQAICSLPCQSASRHAAHRGHAVKKSARCGFQAGALATPGPAAYADKASTSASKQTR